MTPIEIIDRAFDDEDPTPQSVLRHLADAGYVVVKSNSYPAILSDLRNRGWMVAVHNDYRQDGKFHTFWLFTHPDGRWIKGEGTSDEEALQEALSLANAYRAKMEKSK